MDKIKCFCFVGEPESGKSTTMGKILREFLNVDISKPKIRKDFCLSFIYDGELIGICSVGDSLPLLREWLIPLKEKGCKKIICACHPKENHREFLRDNFDVEEIECIEVGNRDNEEEWKEEHLRRINYFKRVFR